MTEGWVKNWRTIKDWEWYKTPNMAHLFQHLIREANHETRKWQGITIERGQLPAGRKALAKDTGLSEQEIRTCLAKLKSTSEITIQSTNRFSIITISNYSRFQGPDDANQPATQPATQPTINQQSTTLKNDKNVKKERINTPLPPLQGALAEWVQYRKEIKKPISQSTVVQIQKDYAGREDQLQAAVAHSKRMGWQGLFPPKAGEAGVAKETNIDRAKRVALKLALMEDENESEGSFDLIDDNGGNLPRLRGN